MIPVSRLALFLLGPPRLELAGQLVEINRRKAVALVAYLAVTGASHSRDALATLLWPDYDQTRARAALRRTLSVLNQLLGEWLEIDRETVTLKTEAEFWLDVHHFRRLLTGCQAPLQPAAEVCAACLSSLAEAVALYGDHFLAGFTLRDSPGFDEWQFFQGESLRRELAGALERLVSCHSMRAEFEPAILYARRWLGLDPLHEPVHRWLMQLYTWTDQRAAALRQYGECVRVLREELGVLPSTETTTLYERIQAGELIKSVTVTKSNGKNSSPVQGGLAPFPIEPGPTWEAQPVGPKQVRLLSPPISPKIPTSVPPVTSETDQNVFVAREGELARLDQFLTMALAGRGQVVFIVGEAGSGKTALVHEFARQVQAIYPDLIVAVGHCNTHTGLGDPYLPFREALELLTGDVEAKWVQGLISQTNADRLTTFLPTALQILLELGPGLIDSFIPGAALAARAAALVPAWARPDRLEQLGRRKGADGPVRAEQSDLLEQFSKVIQALARQQPLLLALEDLQWVDVASISLLFHLGRRIEASRVLLVVTYRPDDVALGRAGERHPLESVVNELKRRHGDSEVDLDRAMGRHFVEALLDTQPNRLGAEFRAALYERTQGHPLFTVELLRDMQEHGDLIRDEHGYWVEGQTLNWDLLPARVEAVIEERIDRLDTLLREILTVASVEGRDFTAQVIARVQKLPERPLLRRLSQELEKRHHLIREQGEIRVGDQRLSRYQFAHVLFQQYLYNELSAGERRLLHGEIAAVLEELHQDRTEEIMVQLAYHYAQAGQPDKATGYLLAAGDRARAWYAHREAIDFYQQALIFLKEQGTAGRERAARTLMKLGLTYHLAFDFRQARRSYDEGFAMWQWAGESQPASPVAAPHALRLVASCDPAILDPALAEDSGSINIIEQLFSGLVSLSPELDVMPELARSWEVLEGGHSYLFHLRDDICWSDGSPVRAEDFVYSWRRTLQPATRSPVATLLYDLKGARAFHQGELSDPAALGVRALDGQTLWVELDRPTGYFPHLLASNVTYPLPQRVVEAYGEVWTEAEVMVTNGPFRVKTWHKGQAMTLVRNPLYRGHFSGNVQQVELSFGQAASTHLERYEAGHLDVLYLGELLPLVKDRARQRHAGEYVMGPGLDTTYVGFDVSRPPFNDRRVRQAFVLAIDREMLASVILGGYASPALGGFVPPGLPGHSPDIGLPYDPERARQLLAEAGYPGGRNFPQVEWLIKPHHHPVAEYLQTQWAENLGITLAWQNVPWTHLDNRLASQIPHLVQMGWMADYFDPDNFLRVSVQQYCPTWRNPAYEELLERARQVTDPAERLQLHQQADRLLVEAAPLMPLTYKRRHMLVKPWVSKFPTSAIKPWYWKDVIIEPHEVQG